MVQKRNWIPRNKPKYLWAFLNFNDVFDEINLKYLIQGCHDIYNNGEDYYSHHQLQCKDHYHDQL